MQNKMLCYLSFYVYVFFFIVMTNKYAFILKDWGRKSSLSLLVERKLPVSSFLIQFVSSVVSLLNSMKWQRMWVETSVPYEGDERTERIMSARRGTNLEPVGWSLVWISQWIQTVSMKSSSIRPHRYQPNIMMPIPLNQSAVGF